MASLYRKARFWIIGYPHQRAEAYVRLRSWWCRHWWPARIRQLDRERRYWRAVVMDYEAAEKGEG